MVKGLFGALGVAFWNLGELVRGLFVPFWNLGEPSFSGLVGVLGGDDHGEADEDKLLGVPGGLVGVFGGSRSSIDKMSSGVQTSATELL